MVIWIPCNRNPGNCTVVVGGSSYCKCVRPTWQHGTAPGSWQRLREGGALAGGCWLGEGRGKQMLGCVGGGQTRLEAFFRRPS